MFKKDVKEQHQSWLRCQELQNWLVVGKNKTKQSKKMPSSHEGTSGHHHVCQPRSLNSLNSVNLAVYSPFIVTLNGNISAVTSITPQSFWASRLV